MKLHADFSKRVEINTNEMEWIASPAGGVDRKMLDRIGDEKARATSIVRYATDSAFPEHEHRLGEEFYVLEGIFSDEHGDHPAGPYVRNPDGTRNSPFSKDGCTILVKLRQFEQTDDRHFSINKATADWEPRGLPGLSVIHLHEHEMATVRLVKFDPGARVEDDAHPGDEELLVLEGTLYDEHGSYPAGTWLHQPDGQPSFAVERRRLRPMGKTRASTARL